MARSRDPEIPPNGRLIAAGLALAGAAALLVNHFLAGSHTMGRMIFLSVGPIALLLGLGGVVEPKIMWSVGTYGKDLPVIYKVVGALLGLAGLAVTALLLLFVYRVGPLR